eukprot:gene16217-biopygen8853
MADIGGVRTFRDVDDVGDLGDVSDFGDSDDGGDGRNGGAGSDVCNNGVNRYYNRPGFRGVARAPSAGGRTGLTQGIPSVCRKQDASAGPPRRPRPGRPIHFPIRRTMDWKADSLGSAPNREAQGISTAKP